jgi:hypothetical protein
MTETVEIVAKAIWEKRRELAKRCHGIDLEAWGDGSIPRANHVFEEAQAAIEAMVGPSLADHDLPFHSETMADLESLTIRK